MHGTQPPLPPHPRLAERVQTGLHGTKDAGHGLFVRFRVASHKPPQPRIQLLAGNLGSLAEIVGQGRLVFTLGRLGDRRHQGLLLLRGRRPAEMSLDATRKPFSLVLPSGVPPKRLAWYSASLIRNGSMDSATAVREMRRTAPRSAGLAATAESFCSHFSSIPYSVSCPFVMSRLSPCSSICARCAQSVRTLICGMFHSSGVAEAVI